MKKVITSSVFLIFFYSSVLPQENKKAMTINGYVTCLQRSMFDSLSGPFVNENLVHNRLNFSGFITGKLTLGVEIRNRLFSGGMVKRIPGYADLAGEDKGWVDLSWNFINKNSYFLNTTIDRLKIDLNLDDFQLTVGRQRINWGQTFVWNPNDIFNAYSFFDFDYAEKPGSDAVRLQFYPTFSSVAEVAVKADHDRDVTAAGLYRFSKWGYDIQFLAGYFDSSDFVAGMGWSGAIGSASFRGEGTWFRPVNSVCQADQVVLITSGFDKIFESNSMLQVELMYCSKPPDLSNFNSFYYGNLSAKDLAFSEFTVFGQFTWAVNPLLNITSSAIWFPDLNGYFLGPSIDFSFTDKIDFSAFFQHFNAEMGSKRERINMGFLRLKYSF